MRSSRPRFVARVFLPTAVLALGLVGCRGEKVTTIALAAPGTAEGKYQSGPDVVLWADSDGEWRGSKSSKLSLIYDVEVFQAGAKVGQINCATTSSTTSICGSSRTFGSERSEDCEVLLKCELPATKPGEVVLRVTGQMGDPARTKRIKKMDLVVRRR